MYRGGFILKIITGGVVAPKGFTANGIHAGIRQNKSKIDLSLIYSEKKATAAAVYTTKLVTVLSKRSYNHLLVLIETFLQCM